MRETWRYYRDGFPGAFLECLIWMNRPHRWWGWIIAAPLWPFTAYIVMTYQGLGKWPQGNWSSTSPGTNRIEGQPPR